jgi:peptidoglycan/LPS O-acetylase OafA/YrhL
MGLIIFGAAALERSRGWQFPGWLQSIGAASYSIYLVHLACYDVVHKLLHVDHAGPGHLVWVATLLTAGITVGFAVHHAVERPLQRLGRRKKVVTHPIEYRRAA